MKTWHPIYAVEREGKIRIIVDTYCSALYCVEFGCDFPNCAEVGGRAYETMDDAKRDHPNIELVR